MASFKLSERFLSEYKIKPPDWGPLGYITYKRTYARPIEDRTEEWWETVCRVVQGTYNIQKQHCETLKLPWNGQKAQNSAQEMYRLMFDFKFLPPGRGLWMMGTQFVTEKGSAALNNCGFTSTKSINVDFAEPFCWAMDMSMLGVGVGFDTKGADLLSIKEPRQQTAAFVVEDTREGWVDLLRVVLNAYIGRGYMPGDIDVTKVRPYGALINGFGGTASGPGPLLQMIEDIHKILRPLIGQTITAAAIVDLFNVIGKCVVSGNVRRSAMIALGEPDDQQFLDLKNPELNQERMNDWGWASNNSVFATIGMDYSKTAEYTKKNGEIGYFWLDTVRNYGRMADPKGLYPDLDVEGTNPCSEQSLEDRELCCLVETFPGRHETSDEYQRTLKFAYLYAKTVTLLPTHSPRTNAVMLRNRRIGTSQSGIVQSIYRHGFRNHFTWCDEGYKYIRSLDNVYSRWLCVPTSIKVTSVKPSGTVSLLPGVTPGVHFPHSEYYWRTIRFDAGSSLVEALREAGYRIVEGEGANTAIVYFPVKEKDYWKGKNDITVWEQLEITAQMQHYWADNQVSVTVSFLRSEEDDIQKAIETYETRLKSVSFLPHEDHGFDHAPYQEIDQETYEAAIKTLKPIKLNEFKETEGFAHKFCDSDSCELPS